jgi:hypothetical protein
MPGLVPPVANELDGLLAFLEQQRTGIRASVYRLTEEQATSRPTVSELTPVGLVKHVALTEQHWTVRIMMQRELPDFPSYELQWHLAEGESVASVLDFYAEVGAETERLVRGLPDLDFPVPVPHDAPWFPSDVDFWSARWVLLHLIEETARHAGHADILREAIDGATLYPLLAAYESSTEVKELTW